MGVVFVSATTVATWREGQAVTGTLEEILLGFDLARRLPPMGLEPAR